MFMCMIHMHLQPCKEGKATTAIQKQSQFTKVSSFTLNWCATESNFWCHWIKTRIWHFRYTLQ